MSALPSFAVALAAASAAYEQLEASNSALAQKLRAAIGLPFGVAALPVLPATPSYPVNKLYHLAPSPAGDDAAGDGSQARPFASVTRAIQQIQSDRAGMTPAALDAVLYRADGTWTQSYVVPRGLSNVLFSSWGATSPEQRPTIQTTAAGTNCFVAIAGAGIADLKFRGLCLQAGGAGDYGIWTNGVDGVEVDYCEFDGFGGLNCCVGGGARRFRFQYNWSGRAGFFTDPTKTMQGSGLYTEAIAPVIQCNTFYGNGYNPATFDAANPADTAGEEYRHGVYESHAAGATPGTYGFNLYLANGACGHQARNGGVHPWNVYCANGELPDSFTDGLSGEYAYGVVLGNPDDTLAVPSWGLGLQGQSVAFSAHDLLFLGQSDQGQNAAITLANPQFVDNPPALSQFSASVANLQGVWHKPALAANGRSVAATNVNVRLPAAGETLPTLPRITGDATLDALAMRLRKSLTTYGQVGALAIIQQAWSAWKTLGA